MTDDIMRVHNNNLLLEHSKPYKDLVLLRLIFSIPFVLFILFYVRDRGLSEWYLLSIPIIMGLIMSLPLLWEKEE